MKAVMKRLNIGIKMGFGIGSIS